MELLLPPPTWCFIQMEQTLFGTFGHPTRSPCREPNAFWLLSLGFNVFSIHEAEDPSPFPIGPPGLLDILTLGHGRVMRTDGADVLLGPCPCCGSKLLPAVLASSFLLFFGRKLCRTFLWVA